MKKIILIFFISLFLINSVCAYNFEETIYGLESEEPTVITFDNNTGSVNSSDFWDDLDTPENIAYSDLYTNFWDTNVNFEGFNITNIDYLNVSGRMRLFMPFGYAYGFRVTDDDDEHTYAGMLSTGEVGVFVAGSETGASVDLSLMNSLTGAEVERLRIDGVTGLFDFKGNDVTNINNLDVTYNITANSFSNLENGNAAGQMAFWNGTKWVKTETSELFWDDTNKRLGIGERSPARLLEISTKDVSDVNGWRLNYATFTNFYLELTQHWNGVGNGFTYKFHLKDTDGSGFEGDVMAFHGATGNVGIGTTSPDTKLQVVGDFSLQDDSDKIFLGASQDVSLNFNSTDFVETVEVGSFNRFWNGFSNFFFGDSSNYLSIASDGELGLTGTARVTRHLRVGAGQFHAGASAPSSAFEGVFHTFDFDSTSDDECHFILIMPYRWDNSTDVEFAVDWFYDGVQDNGNINWALEYKSIKEGEAVTGTGITINQTSAGTHTTGQMVRTTFTDKILSSNLERHDSIAIRLYRDISEDTLTADSRLINTHFHFTQNSLGEPT